MAPSNKEDYFKTMEEQLQNGKIITFKWLSRTFNIHCNIAKEIMKEFVEKESLEKTYNITFLIFGKEDGDLVIKFYKENDSSAANKLTIIEKYIYSIELASSDFDSGGIYDTDKETFELEKSDLSSIKYPGQIIRKNVIRFEATISETENLPKLTASKTEALKVTSSKSVAANTSNSDENIKDKQEMVKNNKTMKTTNKSSMSDGSNKTVPIFFQKRKPLDDSVGKEELLDVSKATVSCSEEKVQESIIDLKTKQLTQPNKNDKSNINNSSKKNVPLYFQKKKPFVDHVVKEEFTDCEEKEKEGVTNSTEKMLKHPLNNNKKEVKDTGNKKIKLSESSESGPKKDSGRKTQKSKKSNSKGNRNKKKFKKIAPLDSSSESEPSEEDSFEDLPEEPEYGIESPKQNENDSLPETSQSRKRKRKIVEKNIFDDDGFLHTKKEIIYESCSEDNDENVPNENLDTDKPSKINNSRSSISSEVKKKVLISKNDSLKNQNSKVKQSSITSFFKKS